MEIVQQAFDEGNGTIKILETELEEIKKALRREQLVEAMLRK